MSKPESIKRFRRVRTFKKAKEQLLQWLADEGIELCKAEQWQYRTNGNKIIIDYTEAPDHIFVWTLCHEIGHIISECDIPDKYINKDKLYAPRSWSSWEKEDEFRAWANAEKILDNILPCRYNKKYIIMKHKRLGTYYQKKGRI